MASRRAFQGAMLRVDALPQRQHADTVRAAARKLDRYMLPFVFLFSVISSIDRANVAFAAVEINAELGFTAETYGLGATIFFVSYSLFQVPSNVLFLLVGGPAMLGGIAVAWGIIASSMAAVQGRASFLAVRFLLGIAEAGTVPGIWAYLSRVYPGSQLTVPTTVYMSGITAAQAIGTPLAAGLLSMHGIAGMSGWRWLFIIEGIPSVLMGLAIWAFLPRDVAHCSCLTPQERAHMQVEIQEPSLNGSSGSSICEDTMLAPTAAAGPPSKEQLASDLAAVLRCRVVWCASGWRFLYLVTLNGLIFFTPLLVLAMRSGCTGESPATMLLIAVPYIAGIATHIANGLHSRRSAERRWHIAVPWLWGGLMMCVLPAAWAKGAGTAAFALLVLACMGVMGCDGIDVAWIVSLMQSSRLSGSQVVLAMSVVNMLANVGGFVGPYANGALRTHTGAYFAGCWMMGGAVLIAAACVASFPLAWAGGDVFGCGGSSAAASVTPTADVELAVADDTLPPSAQHGAAAAAPAAAGKE